MEQIYPYLYRTEPQALFEAFKVSVYLLVRQEGNLLVYSSKNIETSYDLIKEKGGLKAILISHVHEASEYCNRVANYFNVPFYSPESDSSASSRQCKVDKTYSGDIMFDESFEIISTPGHTPGSSCFLWSAPDGKRILFTGDNLYPTNKNQWDGYAMKQEDIPQIIQSLRKIQEREVDVIVPAGHSLEDFYFKEVTPGEWKLICEGAIMRFENQL